VLAVLLLLLIVAVFIGGLAVKALLWLAAVMLVLWLLGWMIRPTGRTWYYW